MAEIHLRSFRSDQKGRRVRSRCADAYNEHVLAGVLGWVLELSGMNGISCKRLDPSNFGKMLRVEYTRCKGNTVKASTRLRTCVGVFCVNEPFFPCLVTFDPVYCRRELDMRQQVEVLGIRLEVCLDVPRLRMYGEF